LDGYVRAGYYGVGRCVQPVARDLVVVAVPGGGPKRVRVYPCREKDAHHP